MKLLAICDFEHKSEYISFEGHTEMWNKDKVRLSIDFAEDTDRNECLKKYIDSINEQLLWLERNKLVIENYLTSEEFVNLAENWASSAEEAEDEEQECYIMENGTKVFFPISEEDFCNSLYLSSIGLDYQEDEKKPQIEIYLRCNPDYFAAHAINVSIDGDKNVDFAALAG